MSKARYVAMLIQSSILMGLCYYKIYWAVVGLIYFGIRSGLARLEVD